MKDYLKLLRVKHYIKNFLVFVPLFFGGEMLSISKMGTACLGCFAFSAISSQFEYIGCKLFLFK